MGNSSRSVHALSPSLFHRETRDHSSPVPGEPLHPLRFSDEPSLGVVFFCLQSNRRALTAVHGDVRMLLGEDPKYLHFDGNLFLRHIHPDDRFTVINRLDRALSEKRPLVVSYRWRRPDNGKLIQLHCRASASVVEDCVELSGILLNTSFDFSGAPSLESPQLSLAEVLRALPGFSLLLSRDLIVIEQSGAREQFVSCFDGAEFQATALESGSSFIEGFYDRGQQQYFREPLSEILSGARPHWIWTRETPTKCFQLSVRPVEDDTAPYGILLHLRDITRESELRRRSEQQQDQLLESALATARRRKLNGALQTLVGHLALMQEPLGELADKQELYRPLLESSRAALRQSWFAFEADAKERQIVAFDELTAKVIRQTRPLFPLGTEWDCTFAVQSFPIADSASVKTILVRFFSVVADAVQDMASKVEVRTSRARGTTGRTIETSATLHARSLLNPHEYCDPLTGESLLSRLIAGLQLHEIGVKLSFKQSERSSALECILSLSLPSPGTEFKASESSASAQEQHPEILIVGELEVFSPFQEYFRNKGVSCAILSPGELRFQDFHQATAMGLLLCVVDFDSLGRESKKVVLRLIRRFARSRFLFLAENSRPALSFAASSEVRWIQKPATPSQISYHLKRAKLCREYPISGANPVL